MAELDQTDIEANELLVTGGVFAMLCTQPGVSQCQPVFDEEGNAQTAIHIWVDYMKSRYRLTVTMDPEENDG